MTTAIILAAGNGSRFGRLKQFEEVGGKRILDYTIDIYKDCVDEILLVLPKEYRDERYPYVHGGDNRFDSISEGFHALNPCEKILIVDAVRCNTSETLIKEIIEGLDDYDCVFPSLPTVETQFLSYSYKLESEKYYEVKEMLDKTVMRQCQTPEGYTWEALNTALVQADSRKGFFLAYHLMHSNGFKIGWVEGEHTNIKITYPIDLIIFEALQKIKWDVADNYLGGYQWA